MNLARAFAAMAALALVAVLFAVVAFASALRVADADVVVNAHAVVTLAARTISTAYTAQIATLRSELAAPIARTALDSYARRIVSAAIGDNEGVDGGLFLDGGIVGDGPQPVAGSRERAAIATLAGHVQREGGPRSDSVTLTNGDVVAIDAVPLNDKSGVAWARERIPASALRGRRSTVPLIASAAACCLLLVGIGAWIVWVIRRDARRVVDAIAVLEANPAARPALPRGDFGTIARAVSTMAARRAAAEATAQRNERLAAIGRLAANAAHEIRNPLNSLRLQIDVLHRRMGPALDEPAARLQSEIARLDAVVVGMLEVGGDAPIPRQAVDLRDVTRRAIDVLEVDATARRREIRFACTTEATTVNGDAGRLVQLTLNILANAVDAAPLNSTIEVRLSRGPVLTVVDRGAGIAGADLPQVFEPFFTTKPAGTGLGLAIAYEIARGHGARIDVRSVPGQTAFAVDFGASPHAG